MEGERFVGLDKKHGFFRHIQRNQMSRDNYNREEQERKQIRRAEVTEEWRQERRRQRKPDLQHYVPPNSRHPSYLLEVEVAPGRWYSVEVKRNSRASEVAAEIASAEGLSLSLERALTSLLKEKEMELLSNTPARR